MRRSGSADLGTRLGRAHIWPRLFRSMALSLFPPSVGSDRHLAVLPTKPEANVRRAESAEVFVVGVDLDVSDHPTNSPRHAIEVSKIPRSGPPSVPRSIVRGGDPQICAGSISFPVKSDVPLAPTVAVDVDCEANAATERVERNKIVVRDTFLGRSYARCMITLCCVGLAGPKAR